MHVIVYIFLDGCLLVGYDSLLVCWLSSTSKSGTFCLLAPFNITYRHMMLTHCPPCCSPTASPSEFRARGLIAEHVRGRGVPADWPANSARDLWASSQGIHAASCWAADQEAGGGGLQNLSKHWVIFHLCAEVVFGSLTVSLWISLGSTPSLSLCRLITYLWLKMDLSLQIAVKWLGIDYTVRSDISHLSCPFVDKRVFSHHKSIKIVNFTMKVQ